MLQQMTLWDTPNATSSPGSEAGHSQLGSPAGPTTASCGPARVRASRSASPAKAPAPTTSGICGPTSFACSVPDGPLSGWESRLRQRLARIGSTECFLTWKASTTPAGRPLSRLVPSMGRTVEIVSGSSPSEMALWVTASARDWKDTPGMATSREDGRSRVDQLPRQVAAALWATPTVAQPGGSPEAFLARKAALNGACGVSLTDLRMQAQVACWPTPTASLADKGVRSMEGAIREAARSHGPDLAAVTAAAVWGTPTASSKLRSEEWLRSTSPSPAEYAAAIQKAHGADTPGSSATTEKPGALAPEFVAWLMGFPPEWLDCAPETMPRKAKSK